MEAPKCGIDFLDHARANRPEAAQAGGRPCRCGCGDERRQKAGPGRDELFGPLKRPVAGTSHELDEEEAARAAPSEMTTQDQQPYAGGAATIVCDGSGGYGVELNGWAGAPCGIEACVRRHEESHASDWATRWPNGCKEADGTNKPAGAQIPLGGAGYAAFLKQSECDAYTIEETCISPLIGPASAACKPTLRSHLTDTQTQKASFCGP